MPDPSDPTRAPVSVCADPPGWQARLELGFADRGGRTVIAHRHQRGPLAVQRPFYPEGGPCHVYLLHPPGGLVGGDRLEIAVRVGEGAHALLTAPGATKLYRSAGPSASQTQRLHVEAGATLEWLPQENILFPGANVRLCTRVDLDLGGRFVGWELHSLGRPAIGERFAHGSADLSFELYREGAPLILDRLCLERGLGLDGPSGLRGFPVTGTLVASGANAADLSAVRADREGLSGAGCLWGATLVGDLLAVRTLAQGTEPARRLFAAVWGILRPRILGLPPCTPRIWGT